MNDVIVRDWVPADFERFFQLRRSEDPTMDRDFALRAFEGGLGPQLVTKVAMRNDEIVGYAVLTQFPIAPIPALGLIVDSKYRGQGIGSTLMNLVLAAHGDHGIGTACRDVDPRDRAFAERYGFEVKSHGIRSVLAAADVAMSPVALDFAITVQTDDDMTPAQEAAISELMVRGGTNPESEQLGWTMDVPAMRQFLSRPLWVTAWDGDKAIAHTNADMVPEGTWYVGYTVVDPDYRRRGLSRGLKQLMHQYGIEHGVVGFDTENEETNVEIRALNASMGYRITEGDYRFVRPGASE